MSAGSNEDKELLYKILVVGDVGVGKTSVVKRYAHGMWAPNYKATIGVDFSLKEVYDVAQNTTIRVQLWDIAGQERYKNLTRVYYTQAVGAIIVHDGTREATLDGALEWKSDLDHKVFLPGGGNIPCVLLRNKTDLPNSQTLTASKKAKLLSEHGFLSVHDTSAKTGAGVDKAIGSLVQHIYDNNIAGGGSGGGYDDDVSEDSGQIKRLGKGERGILTGTRDPLPGVARKQSCAC